MNPARSAGSKTSTRSETDRVASRPNGIAKPVTSLYNATRQRVDEPSTRGTSATICEGLEGSGGRYIRNSRRSGSVKSAKQVKLGTPEKWTALAPGSSLGSVDLLSCSRKDSRKVDFEVRRLWILTKGFFNGLG